MTEIQAPKNTVIDVVNGIIHGAIMEVGVRAAIAAATSAAPWLGLPVVSQVFSWAVNYFAAFLSKYIEECAAFAVIDAQTDAQAKAYQESVLQLKIAQESGDPHAVEKATEDFKETLKKLIKWDGSGHRH